MTQAENTFTAASASSTPEPAPRGRPWFFGLWLVDQQIVTDGQLREALVVTSRRNTRIGELAVRMGYIDEGTCAKVVAVQRKQDILFGDAARELGVLTEAQISGLLRAQRESHLRVGEALVELGHLRADQVTEHLARFAREQAELEATPLFSAVPTPGPLAMRLIDLVPRLLRRTAQLTAKLGPARYYLEQAPQGYAAQIELRGAGLLCVALDVDGGQGAAIAERFLGLEPGEADEEMIGEAIKELLNIIAGTAKSYGAADILLGLPSLGLPAADGIDFPLECPEGAGRLIIATQS